MGWNNNDIDDLIQNGDNNNKHISIYDGLTIDELGE